MFLRYVLGPDKDLVVDYRGRLPGRGAYTCKTKACIDRAVQNNLFSRAFRKEVSGASSHEILGRIETAIKLRISGLIGVARKSGDIVSGTSQIQAAFSRKEIRYILVAADATEGAAEKMIRLANQHDVGWSIFSDQQQLGQLVGRENRNCIGITDQQFAEILALEINCLQHIAGEN